MKKTLFAILAILFTIALISTCDLLEPPGAVEDDSPRFTPDGRPMVRVTLDLGNGSASRALIGTDDVAKNDSEEYEVAFLDSSNKVYRLKWNRGESASLLIPVGGYAGADKAVVFAGTGGTLLAVGSITSIRGTSITENPLIIEGIINEIVFTLYPLEGSVETSFSMMDSYSNTVVGAPDSSILSSFTGNVFKVDTSTTYSGSYEIKGIGALANKDGIKITEKDWTSYSILPDIETGYEGTEGTKVVGTSTNLDFPSDNKFPFDIETSDADGYTMIYIDVPVVAISDNRGYVADHSTPETEAFVWHIRGGVNYEALDGLDPKGGAVMLKVGDPKPKQVYPPGYGGADLVTD